MKTSLALLILALLAGPASAADSQADDATSNPAVPSSEEPALSASSGVYLPFDLMSAIGTKPGGGECYCEATAQCEYGPPSVTCTDTTNPCDCWSIDQDCDNEVRGLALCDGEFHPCGACPKDCGPPVSHCVPSASCEPGCDEEDCPGGSCIGGSCNCEA